MNTDPLLKNTLYMYVIISKYHNEVWSKKIFIFYHKKDTQIRIYALLLKHRTALRLQTDNFLISKNSLFS